MPDGNISLDQRIAESLGHETRFPSLTVGSDSGLHNGCQMSWTRSGVRVPPISDPSKLFDTLFVEDSSEGKRSAAKRSALKKSILDSVQDDAKSLAQRVGNRDRENWTNTSPRFVTRNELSLKTVTGSTCPNPLLQLTDRIITASCRICQRSTI